MVAKNFALEKLQCDDPLNVVDYTNAKQRILADDNKDAWSPLMMAADGDYVDVARLLLKSVADINVAKYNLAKGVDISDEEKQHEYRAQYTNLLDAALNGDVQQVKQLLAQGVGINLKDNLGRTALMCAASNDHVDVVKLLLDQKEIAVDGVGNDNQKTALMCAANKGSVELVELLIGKGAKVGEKSTEGRTALMYAAGGGNCEVIKLLLNEGASVDEIDSDGVSALIDASYTGENDAVKLLLENGADADIQKKFGKTALMCAANNINADMVELLLFHGANASIKDMSRKTALDHMNDPGNCAGYKMQENKAKYEKIVQLLESASAKEMRSAKIDAMPSSELQLAQVIPVTRSQPPNGQSHDPSKANANGLGGNKY